MRGICLLRRLPIARVSPYIEDLSFLRKGAGAMADAGDEGLEDSLDDGKRSESEEDGLW
jgi:hypothetical protein